jgi:hypothetical protein
LHSSSRAKRCRSTPTVAVGASRQQKLKNDE